MLNVMMANIDLPSTDAKLSKISKDFMQMEAAVFISEAFYLPCTNTAFK